MCVPGTMIRKGARAGMWRSLPTRNGGGFVYSKGVEVVSLARGVCMFLLPFVLRFRVSPVVRIYFVFSVIVFLYSMR